MSIDSDPLADMLGEAPEVAPAIVAEQGPEVFDPRENGKIVPNVLTEEEQALANAPSSEDTPSLDGDETGPVSEPAVDMISAPKPPTSDLPKGVEADLSSISEALADNTKRVRDLKRELSEAEGDQRKLSAANRHLQKTSTPLYKQNEAARKIQAGEDEQRRQERELLSKYLGRRKRRGARNATSRPMPPGSRA